MTCREVVDEGEVGRGIDITNGFGDPTPFLSFVKGKKSEMSTQERVRIDGEVEQMQMTIAGVPNRIGFVT